MEEVRIKFKTIFIDDVVPEEKKIDELKKWCDQFNNSNLTPEVDGKSSGNLSFRTEDGFIVTASGLKTKEELTKDSFVFVDNYDVYNNTFYAEGKQEPSSESIMHFLIYNTRGDVRAIFHGHNDSIVENAEKLKIPVTEEEQEPGTMEMANEVLSIIGNNDFVVIKNHGFVALGKTMKEAGELALSILKKIK